MTEKYNASEHQVHNDEQEFIAGFNQPTAAEQAKARKNMTEEQKKMSKEREREYKRQEIPLGADLADEVYYSGPDHGHSEKEFGDKGYRRDERLWISPEGKIYIRQNLGALNTGVFDSNTKFFEAEEGDTERHNAEEVTPEEALRHIKFDKESAQSKIKELERTIKGYMKFIDKMTFAEGRINNLPKSGESSDNS